MTSGTPTVCLVRSPWTKSLNTLVSSVSEKLLIASPYVKRSGAEQILTQLEKNGIQHSVSVDLITDLRPESALAGTMDLDAVAEFGRNVKHFHLTHLPSVHAKVYVADLKMAIITSGNLTDAGLRWNVEYGAAIAQESLVAEIRSDFEGFASLGASIPVDDVAKLSVEVRELGTFFRKAEASVRRRARQAFEERLRLTHLQLLRHRAKGNTTHAILSETIRFLLRKGPLRTDELHPLIQLVHPDLCDDSVDRVIDGVHFGKKWKHYVRNAQQYLKRHREIRFDGTDWHLLSRPGPRLSP